MVSIDKENHLVVVDSDDVKEDINKVILETKEIIDEEKSIGVLEAVKQYPKEVFWACVFSIGVVMSGYDAQIITSFYALPAFQKKFGVELSPGEYQITAPWQTALGMGSPIGQVIGTLLVAWPLEWYGRKKTYIVANLLVIAFIFMQFFAPSLGVLTAGEIISGILWGCMVLIGPTYASEISQIKLRGILTALTNLAFVIGQFIANGVATAYSTDPTQWAYKVPFAIQWVWPVLILMFIFFAPESPYWLVRQGRIDDARAAIKQISSKKDTEQTIESRLNLVIQTDALEQELEQKSSYKDLFKGTNLRRTEICTVVYSNQVLIGVPFAMGYSTYFFQLAGLPTDTSFDLSLGGTAIGFVATCCCWVVISYVGRRKLYNFGLGFTTILLWIIGFLDLGKNYDTNSNYAYAQAGMMLIWAFAYQLTAGPLCFVLIGEIPSTKLRGKTIAFSTAVQAALYICATVALPYMLNPGEGNLRGKTGFIFAAFSTIAFVWCYFRLPETAGRSFEEIDLMFHHRLPTRKFKDFDMAKSVEL